jgi:hypothetical protein
MDPDGGVMRQNDDGSWSPAEPKRMPWWIRLERWWFAWRAR